MPGQKHKTVSPLSDQNSPKKQETRVWSHQNELYETETQSENETIDTGHPQGASGEPDASFCVSDALRQSRENLDETASHELMNNQTKAPSI